MATPIIKIKRGSGTPTISGVTYGEFAYDRDSGILYLGISGGGYSGDGTVNLASKPINIPIGMQVSDDATFAGPGTAVNTNVGYSSKTVPTTHAVKDFVSAAVSLAALGMTLYPGTGISFIYAEAQDPKKGITIFNIGVIKGFTSFGLSGNFNGSRVFASSAVDGLTFIGGSGILISGDNTNRTLTLTNIGVTGINGATGGITLFSHFAGLSGFTSAVGYATNVNLNVSAPIDITKVDDKATIFHATSGVASGKYGGSQTGFWKIPEVNINSTGHITSANDIELKIGEGFPIPAGLTETVQDIIFKSTFGSNGIGFTYNDGSGTGSFTNTGVRSLEIFAGAYAGLTGAVVLSSGNGIQLSYVIAEGAVNPSAISIANTSNFFRTITANKATNLASGGIYSGGITGSGTSSTTANTFNDTLELYAGRGIGICAGDRSLGNSTLMFWNTGLIGLTLFNSGGAVVASGISGNASLAAGSNVSFSYDSSQNKITIASSNGGAGAGSIAADYSHSTVPQQDLQTAWTGSGVTGDIDLIGEHGILTRQDAYTPSGDLYIGLSSRVELPANLFPGYSGGVDAGVGAMLRLPTTIETRGSVDTAGGVLPQAPFFIGSNSSFENGGLDPVWNRIEVDAIQSGLTGNISNFSDPSSDPYSLYNLANPNEIEPGKVLRLVATSGHWADNTGLYQTINQGEIKLMGWPSAEHLGSELQRLSDPFDNNGTNVYPCDEYASGCKGMPANLPKCVAYDPSTGIQTTENFTGSAQRPTTKFNTNIVTTESLLVEGDVWVKGNILDAGTGCLLTTPNGTQQNAVTCIECLGDGNVGVTGYLRVDNSLYVHGPTAIFYGGTFATDARIISIGGLSGGNLSSSINDNSDRGVLFYNRPAGNGTPRKSFFGPKTSDGILRYIPDATVANNSGTITVSGAIGPIQVSEVNGIGITHDPSAAAGKVRLTRAALTTATIGTGTINLAGHFDITSSSTAANAASKIIFNNTNGTLLNFGANAAFVDFQRGYTFDVLTAGQFAGNGFGSGNQAVITVRTPGLSTESYIMPRYTGGNNIALVDVGRYSVGSSSINAGTGTEAPLQTLYNKSLADGCIIDCGTY